MAGKNTDERDAVASNLQNGQPTGTVAEIRNATKLQIELDGKLVYKDVNDLTSAEQANDIVQRAIELTALENPTEEPGPSGQAENGKERSAQAEAGEAARETTNGETATKRASQKQTAAAATTGEKREREGEAEGEATGTVTAGATEQEVAEKQVEKRTKKGRITKAETIGKKPRGRPRKASVAKNVEGEPVEVDANAGQAGEGELEEVDQASKKAGPGRPRKSDTASAPAQPMPVNGNAPAANTRSKNE
ncbi:hypothetical protein LshimejAT787_0600880 [Lyophyllum shimeji]|uniref:Uncharacterized protein n=1 Tax=Lyophyllum shimeji TaxID=47721 RepID=A0A9P3PPA5_LYOSH|nr:hypothetical protein LshimejAT787_0600880 [Lyophyllum shimeji]